MMNIVVDIVIIILGSFCLVVYAVEEFLRLLKKLSSGGH